VTQRLVRFDVPLMIAASLLLFALGSDGRIGRVDGLLLLSGGMAYTAWLVVQSRRDRAGGEAPDQPPPAVPWATNLGLIIAGLLLLVLGAHWLVDGATAIARGAGLSELVIGLTIVAAGTSLPELATSILASLRGERDIAVGNIVGSNIFNILVILGITGTVSDVAVSPAALRFDIPIMIVVAVACLPVFFTGARIGRREGTVFLLYYAAYVLFLILQSTKHDALPAFSTAVFEFALPLTFLTLGILAWRWWRGPGAPPRS
jgi:cation:H+ antiporter